MLYMWLVYRTHLVTVIRDFVVYLKQSIGNRGTEYWKQWLRTREYYQRIRRGFKRKQYLRTRLVDILQTSQERANYCCGY